MPQQENPAIVIHKYGGTTIGNPSMIPHIISRIKENLNAQNKVVAVVSAMGRKGDPYATETLLSLLTTDEKYTCPREKDLLMACGEIISAVYLACRLRQKGISAVARAGFEAGIITDSEHGDARIQCIDTRFILTDLEIFPVVVVTGFQGVSTDGRITTLGRGGSDTSALALGAALRAKSVAIYTDTEGVFSADPKYVPSAQPLNTIMAEDITEMAWNGAKVLHPRAAEFVIRSLIPTFVGRIDKPETKTRILPKKLLEPPAMITGIACGPLVAQCSVNLPKISAQEFMTRVFEKIAEAKVSMDMFTVVEEKVRFTIREEDIHRTIQVLGDISAEFTIIHGCKKVSIVGSGMHGMKGVMARFSRCLYAAGIPILQTVDSHATISALVPDTMSDAAQRSLHKEFID